jgi:Nucleoside-diphosphate-sugar pyrophosphorylase involved in lipopolysaccharide biosynthesis/translation initiation factor 2B, gamma/epsilon subunits (eIF-2Bgamma/eIF-2Bepsilon)
MAGGEGKRLKEFSNYFPKPLLPFENSTAIEYIIGNFSKFNVKKFFISVNYKKNLIKSYLKENNYKNISYVEEKSARGTVGSLSMLKNKIKHDFFLINCDTILGINFEKFYEYHKKNKFDLTLVAASKNFKLSYGSCEIKKNGQLNKINEKPNLNYLVNVGLYLIKPEIIKMIPNKGPYDIDELIKKLKIKRKKIGVFPISENSWIDTGFLRNKEINL